MPGTVPALQRLDVPMDPARHHPSPAAVRARRALPTPPPARAMKAGKPRRSGRRLAVKIAIGLVLTALVATALTAATIALVFWHYGKNLPTITSLGDYHPKQVTIVTDARGDRVGEIYKERRTYVPYEQVAPILIDAFVAAEDGNFWNHGGIDYRGMVRAFFTNLRSRKTKHGASTITQQVVKNMVLTPERTFKRKIQEIILARRLESALTKKEILTLYMNEIYFGNGRYGVEEAALFYFRKHASEVNIGEAALLAGLPQGPEKLEPIEHPTRAKERQIYVLNELARHGKITAAEAQKWIDAPIEIVKSAFPRLDSAPEWVEVARNELVARHGKDGFDRTGGEVRTTLDPTIQGAARLALQSALRAVDARHKIARPIRHVKLDKLDAERARLAKKVPAKGPQRGERYEAIVTAVHDGDHELEVDLGNHKAAIVLGGPDDERWNPPGPNGERKKPSERFAIGDVVRVTPFVAAPGVVEPEPKHLDRVMVFAPGPEGAIVVMDPHTRDVLAMVGGYRRVAGGLNRALTARRQPGSSFKPIVYAAALASKRFTPATIVNDSPEVYDLWKPENYKKGAFEGPVRLRHALAKSINTVAIKVLHEIGADAAADLAKQLGIDGKLPRTMSLALGSGEVTPLEMTNAFATFAAGGKYAPPRFVTRVDGEEVPGAAPVEVLPEDVAYVITDMMRSVVEQGTATKAKSLGLTIAGKTGTSNDARDTWFVGMTPDYVIGVWVGNDDNTPMGSGEAGGVTALPAFIDVMKTIAPRNRPFARPASVESADIDLATGLLAAPGAPAKTHTLEVFVAGTRPTEEAPLPGQVDEQTFVTDEYGDEVIEAPPP